MASIKINLKNSGIAKEELLKHYDVVEEIHDELIDKSKDKTDFVNEIY